MLDNIIKKIKENRELAKIDADTGNPNTLIARRGQKRRAEEDLKTLSEEYARALLNTAAFIVVTGSDSELFTKIAEEKFDTLGANGEALYDELVDEIHPTLYEGKESVSNVFDVLGRVLENKALALGINEYPQLTFKDEYRRKIKDRADFKALVTTALNSQVGGELVGVHAVRSVVNKAIARNHAERLTPITILLKDEKTALEVGKDLSRLTPRVYLVAAGKDAEIAAKVADVKVSLNVKLKKGTEEGEEGAPKKTVEQANELAVKNSLTTIKNLMTRNK